MADGTALAAAALAGGIVGAAIAAGWARARRRRLSAELGRTTATLEERERASAQSDAVRSVVDGAMLEGVLLFDREGALAYANDAGVRHLGRRPTSIAHLFPSAAADAGAAAAAGEATVVEVETAAPQRWLRVAATPAGSGRVLIVVADVTDARRVETLRRDFVANASHELKTPAASIRAAAETLLIAVEDDPAAVPRFATALEREAARLAGIVEDLLDLSRLEAGSELDVDVRLDALVAEEARRFEGRAEDAELDLRVLVEPVPAVRGSERDLALLVGNLLDNAIRYTPAGGTIDVHVTGADGQVRLEVTDTGVGIPQRDLDRVLERFYRVDRGRSRRSGGTGLGLSIVRHVVENHGGTVSLTSELGQGTAVCVVLPSRGS